MISKANGEINLKHDADVCNSFADVKRMPHHPYGPSVTSRLASARITKDLPSQRSTAKPTAMRRSK